MKFGVGRKGWYRGTHIKEPYFSPSIDTLSEFFGTLGYPLELHHMNINGDLLYFRIPPRLLQSFPCSQQNTNWYHSAWCTTYQDSIFYVCFWQNGSGKEREREKPLLLSTIFFSFFPSRVYTVQPKLKSKFVYIILINMAM